MDKEIQTALDKTASYLIETQTPEGYWYTEANGESKGPEYLQKPIVITSEVIDALIHLQIQDTSAITKGIFYCYKEKIEDTDTIELLAYQLKALSYSDAHYLEKKAKHLLKTILNRQNKNGYWPSFPKTSNLTNYLVVQSIVSYNLKENLDKMSEWLLSHRAKDKIGWGLNEDAEKTQVSFTANVLLTLLNLKNNNNLKEQIKFLESRQMKDGGWPSSDLTYPQESTTYATALVCLILMKTSQSLNNKNIEAGIKFLLGTQLENGSWPLKNGDARGEYFTTCYVSKTLKCYQHLKQKLQEENTSILFGSIENKSLLINYLLQEFENNVKNEYLESKYNIIEKILATTSNAVKRRKIILNILENEGEKDTADIIDALKRLEGYKGLHKRSHLAQIKNDMDALLNLGFIEEKNRKYYLVKVVIKQ